MEILIGLFITLAGALIIFACNKFIYEPIKKWRKHFKIIWRSVDSLSHIDVLDLRGLKKYGFNNFYEDREYDKEILDKISKGENILLVGNPLAGKTRSIYESLKKLDKSYYILIPRPIDMETGDYKIPIFFRFWKTRKAKKILFIDDLNKFILKQRNYLTQLFENIDENIVIVSTCRTGSELDQFFKSGHAYIFKNVIKASKISKENGKAIAENAGVKFPKRFDGNIGSIFLPLTTMIERYNNSTLEERGILRTIKRLYGIGIYEENERFSINRIRKICKESEGIKKENYEWINLLNGLKDNGFFELNKDLIEIEEAYLINVIVDKVSLEDFHEMLKIFHGDPEALYSLGNRAFSIGEVFSEKADLMKVSIEAHNGALKFWTKKSNPVKYGGAKNSLGSAYMRLSEVENTKEKIKENIIMAIKAFNEALKAITIKEYPEYYAMTKMNIGEAHRILSDFEERKENAKKAIESHKEALKIYKPNRLSRNYAKIHGNLGIAYWILSEEENEAENAKFAIASFEEALKVFNIERFPIDYAKTQMNLGGAYLRLSEVEEKAKNAKLAIKSYKEALKIRAIDNFPIQYAQTQTGLGASYGTLSEVENKKGNAKKAISACDEALRVYTNDRYPMKYADIQINLIPVYGILAEVENPAENIKIMINKANEALRFYTKDEFPIQFQQIVQNVSIAVARLKKLINEGKIKINPSLSNLNPQKPKK
ncbi:MAG: hypothetical protein JW984_01885 [Deltaproteobacteria bacterium]|uniref:Tetratricopeptide repeat protein n=1 Tax=Candidatus Zymogenus saltonus TaxID=2844893 RepID=A0A9D8KCI4_9DELT|nr:hypothetical protein [Candidatus Zymogenus saltonus]